MAGFIKPTTGNDGERDFPMSSGWYIAQCTDVEDVPPSDRFRNAKPRLCFVFREYDPRMNALAMERAVFICTASVFPGNDKVGPSALYQFAKQIGYRNADQGINPQAWVGRFFAVLVRNTGKAAYVQLHAVTGEPEGETQPDREAWISLTLQAVSQTASVQNPAEVSIEDPPF